jgi:hypothetical protein
MELGEKMSGWLISPLFETGNLKSIFVYSDYLTPSEMKDDFEKFARAKGFIEPSIEREKEYWLMRLKELIEIKEPTPAKIPYQYNFYIIPHEGFWEFYTNVQSHIIEKVIGGLIRFTPKLEHKFLPPNRLISLVKEYESDEMLAFTAGRDYFTLTKSSKLKIISDEVSLRLSSTPRKIWNHYRKLVEEEAIGPLAIRGVRLKILSGQKTCEISITTLGEIHQIAGSRELFHDVRQRVINIMKEHIEWARFFPSVRVQEIEEKGVSICGTKLVQRGRPFIIELSKPLDDKEYEKLKRIFVSNAKKSGFSGIVEDEIEKVSFVVRSTDMKGGGDIMITSKVGEKTITLDPLPSTTIRCLEKLYRIIIEKFDAKALLIEPHVE